MRGLMLLCFALVLRADDATQKLVDRLSAQKGIKITYHKIDGANHFFDKYEGDVLQAVEAYVSKVMSSPRERR